MIKKVEPDSKNPNLMYGTKFRFTGIGFRANNTTLAGL